MENLDKLIACYTKLLTLSEKDKQDYLKTISDTEPEIYDQLIRFSQSEDAASSFFDHLESDLMKDLFNHDKYQAGDQIGPYQLQEPIGSGGMAYVFKASRTDGAFERESAIKFIKRGVDTDEVIKRFQLERNVLASLNHENIAQLHDGGITNDGLPYFVMEYIEGTDIINYCQTHNLTLKERLSLFIQVCKAVDYAHKNLIVHRDIKPGNILINKHGQVKLTDFGIAKLLDNKTQDDFTRPEMRVMTREYASPEQVMGGRITTASDIYQMGLLLYELLANNKAWNKERGKQTFDFKRKILPGELVSIIQTACMEEPDRRYNSVEALQIDITNYVENRPVNARGKSSGYLLKKFVARHRMAVISSAIILLLIAGGLTKYIIDINEARLKADYETVQAKSVANFYLLSFSRQYPVYSNGDTLTVFEMLEDMEEYLDQKKDTIDDPIDEIFKFRLYVLLGDIYSGWNNSRRAINQHMEAANIWEKSYEKLNDELINFDEHNIYSSIALDYLKLGMSDSALYYYQKSIDQPGNNYIFQELSGIAYVNLLNSNYAKADSLYQQLFIELDKEVENQTELLNKAVVLGRLCSYYSRFYYNEKKEIIDSLFSEALSIFEQNKIVASEPVYKVFSDNFKRNYTKTAAKLKILHPDSYAELLNYYGIYLYTNKQYDSALHYFEIAYQSNHKYYGDNNLKSLDNLNNIAAIQRNTGQTQEALRNFIRCWEMSRENEFLHPAQALNYYQNYAGCYFNLKKYNKCLAAMDTLLQMKNNYAPNDVFSINKAKITMADCHYELEQYQQAIQLYDQVITDHQATFGNKGNIDLEARINQMIALAQVGSYDQIQPVYQQISRAIDERLGPEDPFHHKNHRAMVRAMISIGQFESAQALVEAKIEEDPSVTDRYLYQALLAEIYLRSNRTDKAQLIYEKLKADPMPDINAIQALQKLEQVWQERERLT